MKIMCDDLQYLIHFFNDKEHLFKTITMAESCQVDEICNKISSQNGWHSGRFSPSERHYYLNRRLFVENELYEGYARVYGHLKESVPVYPNVSMMTETTLPPNLVYNQGKESCTCHTKRPFNPVEMATRRPL
jgi:hypothetical protein